MLEEKAPFGLSYLKIKWKIQVCHLTRVNVEPHLGRLACIEASCSNEPQDGVYIAPGD